MKDKSNYKAVHNTEMAVHNCMMQSAELEATIKNAHKHLFKTSRITFKRNNKINELKTYSFTVFRIGQ